MVQSWYVQFEGRMSGPYRTRDLRQFVAEGRVTPETPISLDRERWFRASRVVGLFSSASTVSGDGPAAHRLPTGDELAIDPGASTLHGGGPASTAPASTAGGGANGAVGRSTVVGDQPEAASRPPASPGDLPEQFGRYTILRRLGKGGMGTVYLAHDRQIDRTVALKVPLIRGDDPEVLERFLREARAAAAIKNEYVCRIYDVGEQGGIPFVTMEYIEGELLTDLVAPGRRPSQRKLARLVRTLALVLQEAHDRGIVHRDLKPANIMINRRGRPIIMDFGLALVTRPQDPRLTRDGAVMGTLAYMAPEQVRGELEAIGPGCDIYALGVIIYELLTGRVPFSGPGLAVMQQILADPPEPPSGHRADADPALESICLRAMAKRVEDRYGSMRELADALGDYLEGRPVPPPPPPGDPRRDSQFAPGPRASRKAPRKKPSFWKRLRRRVTALLCLGLVGYLSYQFPETSWMVVDRIRDVILALVHADEKTYRIDVSGPNVVVTLDGDVIRVESLDRPMTLAEPRAYHLVVTRDGRPEADRTITVARGGKPATIRLVAGDGSRELEVVEPIPVSPRAPRLEPGVATRPGTGNAPPPGHDPVVQSLIAQLEDEDAGVRRTAVEVLAKRGGKAAVAALAGALEDDDGGVRRSAAIGLAGLGDRDAVPALMRHIADEAWVAGPEGPLVFVGPDRPPYDSRDWGSKRAALDALKRLAPGEVQPALIAAMKSANPAVKSWAARRLAEQGQGPPASPAAPADPDGPAGLSARGRAMVGGLSDADEAVREKAARGLGPLGERAAVPDLIRVLKDGAFPVRIAAAESLEALGDPSAADALAERVADDVFDERYFSGKPDGSKGAALQALRALDPDRVTGALIRALNSENYWVRRWAARALAQQEGPAVIAALADRVADEVADDMDYRDHSKDEALKSLRALDPEAAEQALIRASKVEDARVRAWALENL